MRLIYMGSPQVSIYPLEYLSKNANSLGYEIMAAVSQAPRVVGRGQERREDPPLATFAKTCGIPVLQPEKASDPDFQKQLRDLRPDVIITCAYGQILNDSFLALPKRATINIHPSLLPKYRGATPVQTTLLDDLSTTGVTILFTVKALDAGNIILQKAYPIDPTENAGELSTRLFTLSGPLLIEALRKLEDLKFNGEAQDPSQVSLCRKIKKEDGAIDWTLTNNIIYNRFRAFMPWPGSFTFLDGKRIIIAGMELADLSQKLQQPGSLMFKKEEQALYTSCSKGFIKLLALKPEGSRVLSADAFWNGLRNRDHLKFSSTIT